MPRLRSVPLWLVLVVIALPASAAAPIALGDIAPPEFQPAGGERVRIPLELEARGEVVVELVSGDGDPVRRLEFPAPLQPGLHTLEWDGRDDHGTLVPDEAYHIVVRCRCGGDEEFVIDAREHSGGQSLGRIRPQLSPDGTIGFDLPQPARVLVRVGARGGAMMRTLEGWRAIGAGRVRIGWDGMDASGVESLLGSEDLAVMVAAFALPDATVITTGNAGAAWSDYRAARGWPLPQAQFDRIRLQRDGTRLMRQSQLPISQLRDPVATLSIVEALPRRADGVPIVSGPVTFRVDVAEADRWVLEQSLYEVSFFLDRQFVSEEETGYTPLSWRWDPAGVAPGFHTMTVNVSGFVGHVGVASVRLWIDGGAQVGRQQVLQR